MNPKDGGPAFPIDANESRDRCVYLGMTLRDYFAGQAMQGMLSNFDWMQHAAKQFENANGDELIPKMAYEIADEMLKAREVKP